MTEAEQPNALKIDLADWRTYVLSQDLDFKFVTVSGAHIYGFPSPDSDVDLRGSHQLSLETIVGLSQPNQTIDRTDFRNGIEVDIVSHDIGKYLGLLVKNNGYILEQVFSPIVVWGQEFLNELRPVASRCITRNHYYHYRGFFNNQKNLIHKQETVTVKSVLYAYRVLATGIHLLNTGDVITDLNWLADELSLPDIPELIQAKVAEKVSFSFDLAEHLKRLDQMENRLLQAFEASQLPENPDRDSVNELLIRSRLNQT